jgi:hypothetical protein
MKCYFGHTLASPCRGSAIISLLRVTSRKRPDWPRPLPQPLHILDGDKPILTLATVGDVRTLILKRLLEESREKSTWQYVAGLALAAANGGDGADLSIALRMVLSLEGIACRSR